MWQAHKHTYILRTSFSCILFVLNACYEQSFRIYSRCSFPNDLKLEGRLWWLFLQSRLELSFFGRTSEDRQTEAARMWRWEWNTANLSQYTRISTHSTSYLGVIYLDVFGRKPENPKGNPYGHWESSIDQGATATHHTYTTGERDRD